MTEKLKKNYHKSSNKNSTAQKNRRKIENWSKL